MSKTFNDIYLNRMGKKTEIFPMIEFIYLVDCIITETDKELFKEEFEQYRYKELLLNLFKQELNDKFMMKRNTNATFSFTPGIRFTLDGLVHELILIDQHTNWDNFGVYLKVWKGEEVKHYFAERIY